MCIERDSPLKRFYRRTHAKLARLAGSRQLVWAAGCELLLALVHAWRLAWPGETSETRLRVAPPRKTRPPDDTRVNWPVDVFCFQVSTGGPRWAPQVSRASSGWPGAGKTKGSRGLSLSLHISADMFNWNIHRKVRPVFKTILDPVTQILSSEFGILNFFSIKNGLTP